MKQIIPAEKIPQSVLAEHISIFEKGSTISTKFDFACPCGRRHKATETGGRVLSKVLLSLKCGRRVLIAMPWSDEALPA